MTRVIRLVALAGGLAAYVATSLPVVAAQAPTTFSAYLLEPAHETALARSAAPPSVTDRAGLFLLRATGEYEQVAASRNGFNCLVQRSFTVPTDDPASFYQPKLIAPICFNREASATLMQRDLFIARLAGRGLPLADIRKKESEAYADGTLKYPTRTAIGYMFSSGQWLGATVERWHPHVMVWAPDLTPADLAPPDIGTFGVHSGLPIMDARYGAKQVLIAIPVAKAIDPVLVR